MSTRKAASFYQYPYPAEPRNWTDEERAYGRGLRKLFDILFSRKLQNVLIADKAVNSRTIDDKAIHLYHLRDGFGADLDITENESITSLETGVTQAQEAAESAAASATASRQAAEGSAASASTAQQAAKSAAASANTAQQSASTAQQSASSAVATAEAAQQTASTAQQTASTAQQTASTAQQTADGLTDKLMPVGITVITPTSPSYGTWSQTEVGGMTAWTRTA